MNATRIESSASSYVLGGCTWSRRPSGSDNELHARVSRQRTSSEARSSCNETEAEPSV